MPNKLPIDFQPRQFNAVLISKETGQSIPAIAEDWLKAPITPEPWPVDDVKEEPAKPIVFQKAITIKIPKKDQRAFKRMLRGDRKFPRKLKKAMKHMEFKGPRFEEIKTQNGIGAIVHMEFGPKEGYPHTKWIFRAAHLIKKHIAYQRKTRLNTQIP